MVMNSTVISAFEFDDSNPLLNEGPKKRREYHGQNPNTESWHALILANMWFTEIV